MKQFIDINYIHISNIFRLCKIYTVFRSYLRCIIKVNYQLPKTLFIIVILYNRYSLLSSYCHKQITINS